MKRLVHYDLEKWRNDRLRKPLIMRGARQVGKTHVVRQFGESFPVFIEVNFELQADLCKIFEKDLDPVRITNILATTYKKAIEPGKTLVFFDEIQACPNAITALRYFYENMPELHVIAAGSLLDFAIEQVGVPVGRVSYCYMYPASFMEYLAANGHTQLFETLLEHKLTQPIEEIFHNKLFELLGEYMVLGGMPEILNDWLHNKDMLAAFSLHHNIVNTYRDDFPKYAKKTQIKYLDIVFSRVPHLLAKPVQYSHISRTYHKRELEPALELLIKAGVVHKVKRTGAHGIPLGSEINFDNFKLTFLDTALAQAMLGLDLQDWLVESQSTFINKGQLTESFVGQELLAYKQSHANKNLYYWQRANPASTAEVDYIMQINQHIIPIEVKSGKGSTLKSLRMFLATHKESPYGVRFSVHNYSVIDQLHSYPLYAISGFLAQYDKMLKERLMSLI